MTLLSCGNRMLTIWALNATFPASTLFGRRSQYKERVINGQSTPSNLQRCLARSVLVSRQNSRRRSPDPGLYACSSCCSLTLYPIHRHVCAPVIGYAAWLMRCLVRLHVGSYRLGLVFVRSPRLARMQQLLHFHILSDPWIYSCKRTCDIWLGYTAGSYRPVWDGVRVRGGPARPVRLQQLLPVVQSGTVTERVVADAKR